MYDFLIVGAGLFGSVFACEAHKHGKKCLVIDKRSHIGGNIYTENLEGINVHKYGAHIFHTDNKEIWDYMQRFAEFNRYTNSPVARYKDKIYNLPFNMNTFNELWGVITPAEAKALIERQIKDLRLGTPANLEEQALSMVGRDIYEKLVKGYTEKQWGRRAAELPAFIITRLPVRFTYDNNYFNDKYQGIPMGGYTPIIERMLDGIEIKLNENFMSNRTEYKNIAKKIIYTGMIDEYFDYCYGELDYRSLHFETEVLESDNYQGNAVVNYTEFEIPYTRIIEHKHFEFGMQPKTIITREYPKAWQRGSEPYYPVNDDKNMQRYAAYLDLAANKTDVIFEGRLGGYKYLDMDDIVSKALSLAEDMFA